MWRWAGCSRSRRRGRGPARGRGVAARRLALAVPALAVLWPASAQAQTFLTQEEALELAFPPPATVERRTAFLDQAELALARRAGDAEIPSGIVTYYIGRRGERTLGYAYFDAHRVRTLPEVLMVVVTPTGSVERVEVLKFSEPREYLAPEPWLAQLEGRELGDGLSDRGVVGITGATLTSRAVTRAVRRVLGLHGVIHGEPGS